MASSASTWKETIDIRPAAVEDVPSILWLIQVGEQTVQGRVGTVLC